jgi:hypothetical protein
MSFLDWFDNGKNARRIYNDRLEEQKRIFSDQKVSEQIIKDALKGTIAYLRKVYNFTLQRAINEIYYYLVLQKLISQDIFHAVKNELEDFSNPIDFE